MVDANIIDEYAVVDLFCGAGGLTNGFIKEKINVTAGIDFDETCKYSFEKNNNCDFLFKDITKLTGQELKRIYPKNSKKILVGCAPCQPFSLYSHGNKLKGYKWQLLSSFARLVKQVRPEIVSMENVPQLLKFNGGEVFEDFVNALKGRGYSVSYSVINAQDYGVPQRRKRLILFASLLGEINIIPETHKNKHRSVADAIGHLPHIKDGEHCKKDDLHYSRKLSEMNKKRIIATPEGGGWRDWDEDLVLDCHKKESGRAFGSVYGRMKWNEVSPTMTTCCVGLSNGRFGHPDQDRAISLREAALLQSFPAKYDFIDKSIPFVTTHIARHIGNAVPARLGKIIARSIKRHIVKLDR